MDTSVLIKAFNSKLNTLIGSYVNLKEKNKGLEQEVQLLKQKLEEKEAELEKIQQELKTNNLAQTFLVSEGDTKEAKSRINKIVREIDNCIALLNR